jgi:tetratricopeptide (TPR) repeat protein
MRTLNQFATALAESGDLSRAAEALEAAAQLAREAGDPFELGYAITNLSEIALRAGDLTKALELADEALTLAKEVGDAPMIAAFTYGRALCLFAVGRYDECASAAKESFERLATVGSALQIVWNSVLLSALALREGRTPTSSKLLGYAEALWGQLGMEGLSGYEAEVYGKTLEELQEKMDASALESAFAAGKQLTSDDAVELASSIP